MRVLGSLASSTYTLHLPLEGEAMSWIAEIVRPRREYQYHAQHVRQWFVAVCTKTFWEDTLSHSAPPSVKEDATN